MNSNKNRPLGGFEAWQLQELKRVVSERASSPEIESAPVAALRPRIPRRGLVGVAAAATLGVAAAVGVPVMSGEDGAPAAAYSVQQNDDGTVTVTVRSFTDADGLERQLREYDVNAQVEYTKDQQCQPDRGTNAGHRYLFEADMERNDGLLVYTLEPSDIRDGETLVINMTWSESADGTVADGSISNQLIAGPVAECVPQDMPTDLPGAP